MIAAGLWDRSGEREWSALHARQRYLRCARPAECQDVRRPRFRSSTEAHRAHFRGWIRRRSRAFIRAVSTSSIRERVPAAIWTRGDKSTISSTRPAARSAQCRRERMGFAARRRRRRRSRCPPAACGVSHHNGYRERIRYAERVAERRWRIVLKNGTRIDLGADREVEGLEEIATFRNLPRAQGAACRSSTFGRRPYRHARR